MTTKVETMFDLNAYLEIQRQRVEQALEKYLPAAEGEAGILCEAMRYAVFSGGKRLRPILCLAAADLVNKECEWATYPAVAVELLHTYTLVHDDLPCMDDDDERRGMPTCHIKFGEANAVLVGDALQALAFEVLTRGMPADKVLKLVRELAAAAGSDGVVGGQMVDIANTGKPLDEATLTFIHQHKTADLFRAAVRMGAIAADATDQQLEALTRYACALGIAFQIVDDIIDAREKSDHASIEESSCVRLWGVDEACRRAQMATNEAIAALVEIAPDGGALNALAAHMALRTH